MKWFGYSWGAPCCEPEDHVETPVGKACLYCGKRIEPHDQGFVTPYLRFDAPATHEPQHLDCFLQSILPCPGCPHCRPEKYS